MRKTGHKIKTGHNNNLGSECVGNKNREIKDK